ncbi:MAG: glycosyltransferase [Candidatus Nanopelagicales bacterium]
MGETIRVLLSFPPPRAVYNPYTIMLTEAVAKIPDVTAVNFSWSRALRGGYDVFHVHWPEILVSGHSRVKEAVRQVLFVGFMGRMQLTGVPIVRTVHNLERPEGLSRRQAALLDWMDRRTEVWICLNDATPLTRGAVRETIPHGDYIEWFAPYPRSRTRRGQVAYFGRIRRYKGVERLIGAFLGLDEGKVGPSRLLVGGLPSTEELKDDLTELAMGDGRVAFSWGFQSDSDVVAAVTSSELVALPYVSMHNSGAVLAALSLATPVLVPENEVNSALSAEVGAGWVHTFSGELTSDAIEQALLEVRAVAFTAPPDLAGRDWSRLAQAHVDVYRRALGVEDRD